MAQSCVGCFAKLILIALSNFLFLQPALAEIFTSMADMEALLFAEKQVVSVVDQYITAEHYRLDKLKKFAQEYQQRNQEALHDGSKYLSNPINAYLVVKRLTADWNYVESLMKENSAEEFLQNITFQREESRVQFPGSEDLTGAAQALFRLQDTYKLETGDMARGEIQGVKRAKELSGQDCFELGRIAYNQGDHYHVVMWMQEAISRSHRESPPTISEAEVLEYLAFALYHQGNIKRALKYTKRLHTLDPDHPRASGNIKYYEDQLVEHGFKKGDLGDLPPVVNPRADDTSLPERVVYEALCRNEMPPPPSKAKELKCYYKNDRPFLKLAPLKYDVVHLKPKIVVFRGVLSEYEVEVIKELAQPKLQRATVHNKATGKLEHASYRISKSAWLKGYDHPVVARVNRRMEDMTNLDMETAEDLQIANYGIGGHYDPHYDMSTRGENDPYEEGTGNRIATVLFYKDEKNAFKSLGTGNRIATVLFYLSQPDAGGNTVFPELKLALTPTIYDAAFWHNLYKSSEGDLTTRHAACPVLAGNKWVSNKWIHERGQEFKRPCGLEEFEYE